jgi:hypothetical protein
MFVRNPGLRAAIFTRFATETSYFLAQNGFS